MTQALPPEPDPAPDPGLSTEPGSHPEPGPASAPTTRVLGLTTFTLEGRRAPALFVVGWIATLLGLALVTVGALGGPSSAVTLLSVLGVAGLSLGLVMLAGSQTIERRAAGADYAGPSPVLIFLAVVATSRLLGFLVGLPLQLVADSIPIEVGDLLAVLLQAFVFLGIVRLAVVGPGAVTWAEMRLDRSRAVAVRALLAGAVWAGPVIVLTALVTIAAVQLAGATPPSPLPPTGTASGLVLHLLAGAVIAPVYEEILFRGFALTAWRRTLGDRGAIVMSSLLFVVAHVLFVGGDSFGEAAAMAFVAGVARVPVALALGWLYVRTGSLWAPIGLHATFNGVLILIGELAARSAPA